nr:unnamed protein product [Digitaria exilis]
MSTPTAVANGSPHEASNGAARSPPRPAGSSPAFRTDSPVPAPTGCGGGGSFPESHFGRHLNIFSCTEWPGSGSLARRGSGRRGGRGGVLVRKGVEEEEANTVEQEQQAEEAATEAMARRRDGGCGGWRERDETTARFLSAVASG